MDREKLLDKVKKDIRAMLISAPLGVPAHIFAKDYRQMNGKEIPLRELGYRQLDTFVLSIPDVVRIGTGPTGLVTFYPVATKETQHIVNMIKKQKKPSIKKAVIPSAIVARKTPVKMTSFSRRGGHGARFTPRGGMGSNRHQGLLLPPLPPPYFPLSPPTLPVHLPSSSAPHPHHLSLRPPINCQQRDTSLSFPEPVSPNHHQYSSRLRTCLPDPPPAYFESHCLAHNHHLIPTNHSTDHFVSHSSNVYRNPSIYRRDHVNLYHTRPPFTLPRPFPPSFYPSSPLPPPSLLPRHPYHQPHPLPPSPHHRSLPCCNPPPAKYHNHPRSYSQPGTYYPNAPPRLQRQQHPATYDHPASGPPVYSSNVSRDSYRPHPGVAAATLQPGGGATRPRLSSVPENSGNKLHPQHTLTSLLPSAKGKQQVASSPHSSSSSSSAPVTSANAGLGRGNNNSSGGGSGGVSDLWRDEFRAARHMTIGEMNTWAHDRKPTPISGTVCLEGVASRQREDVYMDKKVFKILLSTRRGRTADGWAQAVQLHFIAPYWDLSTHREPYDVPEGVKLKVYGKPFAAFIKTKDKFEPAMRVLYYETSEGSNNSSGSSAHNSPQESRSTTPKIGADVNSSGLEENIFKLLMKFEKGTYAKRLGKVYQNELKVAPPDNLLEKARNFPFVIIETFSADTEIMYLKQEYRKRGSLQPVQPSPVPSAQPTTCPALPETATFEHPDKLYEVFVCLVNSPFSFYVQIRDGEGGKQQAKFTEMEEKMNHYFSKNPAKAVAVKENDLCACLWSDGEEGQWCRALILSVHNSMANVLFPDYGNQESVAVSELCTLPSQFYKLPFQAIHCSLHGVLREEKMTGPEVDDFFADLASDKMCALQVVDCSGARASVEILDTELDDDETINSKLITKFHPIASLSPQLPEPGEPMVAVKLADVDEHGQLSIQVVGPGLTKLEELANQIEERYSNGSRASEIEVVVGGVYCAEYRLDHSWYRVKVLKQLPQRKVLVEYVDYGNDEEVDETCLRPKLDTALFSLPPQIVKCTMADIPKGPWTSDAIDFLASYIQVDELNLEVVDYCVKVGGGTSLTFPVVELHVKNSEQEMVCINDDMLRHPALFGLSRRESLPSHQQTSTVRASSSVSSAEQLTDRHHGVAAAHPRSHSVSSFPVFSNVSTATDAVFIGTQSQAPKITEPFSNSTSTHPRNNLDSKKSTELKTGGKPCTGVQMYTLQVKDDSFESSSISSVNETSGSNTESDKSEQGSPQFQQPVTATVGRGGGRMELVHSPKECIRDGVPYVASPEEADYAAVKSGNLPAPPSVSSPSSSPPLITSSPPLSPSVIPTTPPMSPPPIPLVPSADDNNGRTEHGDGGVVVINQWAELPRGRAVEVEVTWSCSPTNFTLLLLSNKPELDSMNHQLRELVHSEPHPPQGSLSPGYVCAARYSLDSLWYRAVVRQPFETEIEVEFIDYGGSEMLPLSSIKCLPINCRQLPFQVIKASLYGVDENVTSSPEMAKRFEKMVSGKRLYALKKEEMDFKSAVTLVDTSADNDVVINKEFC